MAILDYQTRLKKARPIPSRPAAEVFWRFATAAIGILCVIAVVGMCCFVWASFKNDLASLAHP